MKKTALLLFLLILSAVTAVSQQTTREMYDVIRKLPQHDKQDVHQRAYQIFLKQIDSTENECKALWHFMTAEMLVDYERQSHSRAARSSDSLTPLLREWNSKVLTEQIVLHYQAALQERALLQTIPVDNYRLILTALLNKKDKPTLYDFFANSFLSYLANQRSAIPGAKRVDFADNKIYLFSDDTTFIRHFSALPEYLEKSDLELYLYVELTKFHTQALKDSDHTEGIDHAHALAMVTLNRWEWARMRSGNIRELLYLDALHRFENQCNSQSESYPEITFRLGQFHCNNHSEYEKISLFDTSYIADLNTALKWFRKTIACKNINPATRKNAQSYITLLADGKVALEIPQYLSAHQPAIMKVRYANLDTLVLRAFPMEYKDYELIERAHYRPLPDTFFHRKYVWEARWQLADYGDHRWFHGELILPGLPEGNYMVYAVDKTDSTKIYCYTHIYVSNIDYSTTKRGDLLTFHRWSGKPLPQVRIEKVYYNSRFGKERIHGRAKTNRFGMVHTHINWKTSFISITHPEGSFMNRKSYDEHSYGSFFPFYNLRFKRRYLLFVTDRSIYRPGQTIHYKGILYKSNGKKTKILPNRKIRYEISDPNYNSTDYEVKVNRYGSFSGEYILPEGAKRNNLSFSKRRWHSWRRYDGHSVRVEEYKRPQFEVIFEDPEKVYALGDTVEVTVKAIAFAGYPLADAEIRYHVSYTNDYQNIHYDNGKLDEKGEYLIRFAATPKETASDAERHIFKIEATVTDITGEVQKNSYQLQVSRSPLCIELAIPDLLSVSDSIYREFPLSITNNVGKDIPLDIHCTITKITPPEQWLFPYKPSPKTVDLVDNENLERSFPHLDFDGKSDFKTWNEERAISSETFFYDREQNWRFPDHLIKEAGAYKITFRCKDEKQNEYQEDKLIYLLDPAQKESAVYRAVYLHCPQTVVNQGDRLELYVGSYLKDAHVLLSVYSGDGGKGEHQWVQLNKEMKKIEIPVKKKYKKIFNITLFLAHKGEVFTDREIIFVPEKKKKRALNISVNTFREQVAPGFEESWEVEVTNQNGDAQQVEILCNMYDASLDALSPNSFLNNSYKLHSLGKRYYPRSPFTKGHSSMAIWRRDSKLFLFELHVRGSFRMDWEKTFPYLGSYTSYLIQGGIPAEYGDRMTLNSVRYQREGEVRDVLRKSPSVSSALAKSEGVSSIDGEIASVRGYLSDGEVVLMDGNGLREEEAPELSLHIPVRRNFEETAFFYPHIFTDKNGKATFLFKTPESLTRWKLQLLAQNRRGYSGAIERTILTQKTLMVVPNPPRFFREKDTIDYEVKIVTFSEDIISGVIRVLFTNTFTGDTLDMVTTVGEQEFSTQKGSDYLATFRLAIPSDVNAITCRAVAVSAQHSDGEERIIPVLPSRIMVTETMPVYAHRNQSKTFTLNAMNQSESAEEYAYTLEISSNPLWGILYSLPTLVNYPYHCSEQIFSRLYANSLLLHILDNNPEIEQMLAAWRTSSSTSFVHPMERNEELKSILNEEMPWAINAQKTEDYKRAMAHLFDKKEIQKRINKDKSRLSNNQNHRGGFVWFSGGEMDPFITQHILISTGRLNEMGIKNNFYNLYSAIKYIDEQMADNYMRDTNLFMQRQLAAPDFFHYLYGRSYFLKSHPLDNMCSGIYAESLQYYKTNWLSQSIYMQAIIALIMHRSGELEMAKEIVSHLKSMALYSDEMGMYWKREGDGWRWHESMLERQTVLIEAFQAITKDQESVEKMQQWLLFGKQANGWGSTKTHTQVLYALMDNYSKNSDSADITAQVGEHLIDLQNHPDGEMGSGYLKLSWKGEEITPAMRSVTIANQGDGSVRGSVFRQYFEELDRVPVSQNGVEIRRELYRVVMTGKGEVLETISEENPLRRGEKVRILLHIYSERELDYVHIKDLRPSAFEPVNNTSGYRFAPHVSYYENVRDVCTNFFITKLRKGQFTISYDLFVTQAGEFSAGMATIQSMYAPEFTANSGGGKRMRIVK
ncbi:hypothetical protein LJC68_03620 [Bacteroidales bacterium OttesenSCG-928-B11]|nr:hypothetical protein [Bacteroidales bacterium OttesenSCG-928-E04]MDL2308695.1 hypothetical protein [Bacteroidales bacterium OttesenSCG-928-C03]MDL2311950.1 hypothetical protein [Bacteroidales bacterium OttesenSCG-928-B11]